MKTKEKNSL